MSHDRLQELPGLIPVPVFLIHQHTSPEDAKASQGVDAQAGKSRAVNLLPDPRAISLTMGSGWVESFLSGSLAQGQSAPRGGARRNSIPLRASIRRPEGRLSRRIRAQVIEVIVSLFLGNPQPRLKVQRASSLSPDPISRGLRPKWVITRDMWLIIDRKYRSASSSSFSAFAYSLSSR